MSALRESSQKTVRRALNALAAAELATVTCGRYVLAPGNLNPRLDEVAHKVGTWGARKRAIERYYEQCEEHRAWLAEVRVVGTAAWRAVWATECRRILEMMLDQDPLAREALLARAPLEAVIVHQVNVAAWRLDLDRPRDAPYPDPPGGAEMSPGLELFLSAVHRGSLRNEASRSEGP